VETAGVQRDHGCEPDRRNVRRSAAGGLARATVNDDEPPPYTDTADHGGGRAQA
jgi:hypothetical protein